MESELHPDYTRTVIEKLAQEELRPIVREAITEETIRAINELVRLAPRAVQLIAQDMESEDSLVRQKAYTLMMKYTVGHPALVQPKDTASGNQITVNFGLPRPEDVPEEAVTVESLEERECDMCHQVKPEDEFVANSSRCQACFDEWKATITADFESRAS